MLVQTQVWIIVLSRPAYREPRHGKGGTPQRSAPLFSSPAFDDTYELAFKCSPPDLKDEIRHENSGAYEDESKQHDLLPCVELAQIDSVQAAVVYCVSQRN